MTERQAHNCIWDAQTWNLTRMRHSFNDPGTVIKHVCNARQKKHNDMTTKATTTAVSADSSRVRHKHPSTRKDGVNSNNHVDHEGLPDFVTQVTQFAQKLDFNGSVADMRTVNQAYDLLYRELSALSFCPDRHDFHGSDCCFCNQRLVYSSSPAPGHPLEQHSKDNPMYYVDDLRPTLDLDVVLTHHCGLHDCDDCVVFYLGCRKRSELDALALSGPVLKHLPAFFALLWPTHDHSFPNLEDICGICAHALSLLLKHDIRAMLHNSLPEIERHFNLSLGANGLCGTAATAAATIDVSKRAELLACLVLSLYGDLLRACKTTPAAYDAAYTKYSKELEEQNNPWGSGLFLIQGTTGANFRMPFWGPLPNACRCSNGNCQVGEHDVEVYHRTLTLVRWTLNKLVDPAVYYHRKTGLGRAFRLEYERRYLLSSVKTILDEQKEDRDRPARNRLLEDIRRKHLSEGAAQMFEELQSCWHLENLFATTRSAGMLVPALLVNSPTTKVEHPFPEDGDAKQKEAWVEHLEDDIWKVLAIGGMTRVTHPTLAPEIRWFARYRTRFDHDYVAVPSAQDLLDTKAAARELTSERKMAIEVNSAKVAIAIKKLEPPGAMLDMDRGVDNKDAFLAWVNGQGDAVMDVYRLAGAAEEDRGFLMALTSQFLCYTWMSVRAERALQRGPEPNAPEIDFWCKNLTMVAGCRAELGFYFRDRLLSEEVLKEMLEAIIKACHPGERWLRSCSVPPAAARARRQHASYVQS